MPFGSTKPGCSRHVNVCDSTVTRNASNGKIMPEPATQQTLDVLKYPIGKFSFTKLDPAIPTKAQRDQWIAEIAAVPARLRAAVAGLTPEQIETPYRPGGWTVRQVVHHVPESHMNAFIRFK